MSALKSWKAAASLGLRLLRGMGTVRSIMVVGSSALASLILLTSFTVPVYFARVTQLEAMRNPVGNGNEIEHWAQDSNGHWIPSGPHKGQDYSWMSPLLNEPVMDSQEFIQSAIEKVDGIEAKIWFIYGSGPVPPGIEHLPNSKVSYASPKLITELKNNPIFEKYFKNTKVKPISESGLTTPSDLIAYVEFDSELVGFDPVQYVEEGEDLIIAWGEFYDSQVSLIMVLTSLGALGLPAIAFMLSTSRLSSSIRERRLASLRLIGLSKSKTQFLSSVETVLTSFAGSILGVLTYFFLVSALAGNEFFGMSWFRATVQPQTNALFVALLLTPVIALLASALPLIRISRRPLAVARRKKAARPTLLRLIPLVAGVAGFYYILNIEIWDANGQYAVDSNQLRLIPIELLAAIILVAVGVPLGLPILIRFTGSAFSKIVRKPTGILISRGVQHDPVSTTRLIAPFLMVLLVGTVFASSLENSALKPQYKYVQKSLTEGPNIILISRPYDQTTNQLTSEPKFAVAKKSLTQISEVRNMISYSYWEQVCDPNEYVCAQILVMSCENLMELDLYLGKCSMGDVLVPSNLQYADVMVNQLSKPVIFNGWSKSEDANIRIPEEFKGHLPKPKLAEFTEGYYQSSFSTQVISTFNPKFEKTVFGNDEIWALLINAGENADEIQANVLAEIARREPSLEAWPMIDREVINNFERTLGLARLVTVMAAFIAFMSLLVTVIDRGRDRRRLITMQRVSGVPLKLLLVSQISQVILPLIIGAIAISYVAALTSLSLQHVMSHQEPGWQWSSLFVTAGLTLSAAFVIAVTLWPTLVVRVGPQQLRRE